MKKYEFTGETREFGGVILHIKKRLEGIEESAELLKPFGGANNDYNYIIVQRAAECQAKKAQKQLTKVIGVLFETAEEADKAYLDALISGNDAREARAAKRKIEKVIEKAGLKEAYKRWEAEG